MKVQMRIVFCLALVALAGITGCGKAPVEETPDKPLAQFLKAICDNNQDVMFDLLTITARDRLRERNMSPGMNTGENAAYEVLDFEYVDEGAHVACNWVEKQDDGSDMKVPVVWIMHKQPEGWRVAGMAMRVFEDMKPVFFNFEDPVDMVHKQELIDQEIARREQNQPLK